VREGDASSIARDDERAESLISRTRHVKRSVKRLALVAALHARDQQPGITVPAGSVA
jgi:hypothetical protein